MPQCSFRKEKTPFAQRSHESHHTTSANIVQCGKLNACSVNVDGSAIRPPQPWIDYQAVVTGTISPGLSAGPATQFSYGYPGEDVSLRICHIRGNASYSIAAAGDWSHPWPISAPPGFSFDTTGVIEQGVKAINFVANLQTAALNNYVSATITSLTATTLTITVGGRSSAAGAMGGDLSVSVFLRKD